MPQNRVIWAVEAVGFAQLGSQTFTAAHGVQSVGVTTTFNLQPVFELGQSRIYENIQDIPDVEVTMEKVLDGYPLLYHLATRGSASATLFGRQSAQSIVALSIFPDTYDSASGTAVSSTVMSGLYVSSLSYTFPADGNFSESVTLVGNNKIWKTPATVTFSGGFDNTDTPLALSGSGGVNRREDLLFDSTSVVGTDENGQANATSSTRCTILPPAVAGIGATGVNATIAGTANYNCSVTNISVSADLGREGINELGHKAPYYRFMNVPVEVQTTIDIISKSGDWISASETQDSSSNATIKIATREGTWIDLGTRNKLSSVNITGGEAGGGNQTISYQFSTYNDFTVQHVQDPTTGLRP
jgi:hypothetical protein